MEMHKQSHAGRDVMLCLRLKGTCKLILYDSPVVRRWNAIIAKCEDVYTDCPRRQVSDRLKVNHISGNYTYGPIVVWF
jgi:hypothetical protein